MMYIVLAAVLGAAAAYFFDRDRGRERRDALGGRASTATRRLRFSQLGSRSPKSEPAPPEPDAPTLTDSAEQPAYDGSAPVAGKTAA